MKTQTRQPNLSKGGEMDREDFNVIANSRGYQVQYKGNNIGGAGISSAAKGARGKQASKQVDDYLRHGRIDIDSILSGGGRPDMLRAIGEIENS